MFLLYLGLPLLAAALLLGGVSGEVPHAIRFLAKSILLTGALIVTLVATLRTVYGSGRTWQILVNLGTLLVSLAIILPLSEFIVRLALRNITTTADNTSYFAQRWRETQAPTMNSLGFREREFVLSANDHTYRIAVIGDSFTYGQGISINDRFTNILERRLSESFSQKYEVLNFGVGGAETVDHVNTLKDTVLATRPNYVLLQWFINDPEGHDTTARPRPWRLLPSDFLSGWLHRKSALYYVLNQQWISFQHKLGLIESNEDYLYKRFRDPDGADSIAARRALEEFLTITASHGIVAGIVIFPGLSSRSWFNNDHRLSFLLDRVLEVCTRLAVTCVDLRPTFRLVEPVSRLWVNRFDSHPGRLANELASNAIFETFHREWSK